MFKYIWIFMIVFVVVVFVVHTIYCCIQEFKDAESLEEWCDYMCLEHEFVVLAWTTIFAIATALLFIVSFVAFCSSFE